MSTPVVTQHKTQFIPSMEYLRECFREEDGRVYWLHRPLNHFKNLHGQHIWIAQNAGREAGRLFRHRGGARWAIKINGRNVFRYQVVWALHYGHWPKMLDHINRNPLDDRIANLRLCTKQGNAANSVRKKKGQSGYKGAYWNKRLNKWVARITPNGHNRHLGVFTDPAEAHKAYLAAARLYYGEFACGNG
jgi:hypothetical protein